MGGDVNTFEDPKVDMIPADKQEPRFRASITFRCGPGSSGTNTIFFFTFKTFKQKNKPHQLLKYCFLLGHHQTTQSILQTHDDANQTQCHMCCAFVLSLSEFLFFGRFDIDTFHLSKRES